MLETVIVMLTHSNVMLTVKIVSNNEQVNNINDSKKNKNTNNDNHDNKIRFLMTKTTIMIMEEQ